ncbi:multidrug ABC transporter permease [Luteimonas padinae]|uniref:ABC transporter permease n=1 Tax=Luteimonas padinae TaxID=1714359 RepID=A0ABV6SZ79_9GAMM|nr:FtsX-like permease family protein [Luteimonas padinae]GHD72661.1 multidrug ABC transporter permease [Luteimonas padinae]
MKQVLSLLALSVRTSLARPRDPVLIAAGFFLSAVVLTVLLAVPTGLRSLATSTGRDDVAMVLSASALDEGSSSIGPQELHLIRTLPLVAKNTLGEPAIAAQLIGTAKFERPKGPPATVQVRGVDSASWEMLGVERSGVLAGDGDVRGIWVGAFAARHISELSAETARFRNADWNVLGQFSDGGSLWDSEIWAELPTLKASYQAESRWSTVLVKLEQPESFESFRDALEADPRLNGVRTIRQSDYYRLHTGWIADLMFKAALAISVLLGAGAVLTIANALSASLERRRGEAATLRALGFGSRSVAGASLLEVVMIGLAASGVAVVGLVLILNGREFGTSSGTHIIYAQFRMDLYVVLTVLGYSLVLGVIASLWPVRQLAYGKLIDGLRAD